MRLSTLFSTPILTIVSWYLVAQPLVMSPSLSPDGSQVAFSYQGDIWTVSSEGGRAIRLTLHEGYDANPFWDATGNMIAFQSDRYGNNDIYTIPAKGGVPNRLTYHSENDLVCSWSADNEILFSTQRIYSQVEWEPEVYRINANGGTPDRYMNTLASEAVESPDGQWIALVRGVCRTSREAYRGPANRNIWLYNKKTDKYLQVTDFAGNDFSPKWGDDNTLYYLTSKSGRYNVHKLTLSPSKSISAEEQVTTETESGLISFSISRNGQKLVYHQANRIQLQDLQSGAKNAIDIEVQGDYRHDPVERKTVANKVEGYAISPNGEYMAYTIRGDIFVTKNDKEDSRSVRITDHVARDWQVTWASDSSLIFISDREGQYDLYHAKSADPKESDLFKTLKLTTTRMTSTSEQEFLPILAPNGKQVAYRVGRGKLIVADIDEHGQLSNSKVLLNGWSTPAGLAWSPDSKWLAYGLSDLDFNQEVFIQKADNSNKAINVSMHPKWDGNPVWSPDGSKLGFVSQRNNGDGDVWFAWLKQEDWERTREEWKRDDPKDNHNETEKNDIRIDPDNIHERLVQVTGFAGNEGDFVISKDGETFYFSNARDWRRDYTVERNLYAIKWDGKDKKEILGGNKNPTALALSGDGDYVFASTNGGKVMRIKAKDGKAETLAVKSKIKANYVQEREQIFEEAWRALNEGFYDPLFHGQDWQSLKEQYKPLALSASTKEDFQFIVNLMLGQLNASHMGLRRGENQKETQKEVTGRIGVTGKNLKKGGFEITSVLPSGPAAKESSQLFVGDIVQRVNGESIQPSTNFYGLFVDQVETPVLLEVNRVKGKTEEVVIWPLKSLNAQLYKAWTDERKRLTEEFSDGRLGYIHIEGMNWRSFERFERELMAAGYGKEGVVIDVRFNGGGWTTDYLMAVLNVRQHAYTIPRGAADNLQADNKKFVSHYPFGERLPLASWTKPSIALCNANSYSNAEIFSHAFKTLDIGTLVGIPTFGAVISTGGWRLVDGSTIRMPFRAWYVKATGENMELGPAVPDIIIDNSPDCKAKKKDEQLQRAVTQLLSEIDD